MSLLNDLYAHQSFLFHDNDYTYSPRKWDGDILDAKYLYIRETLQNGIQRYAIR